MTSAELMIAFTARDRASGPMRKLGANVKAVDKSIKSMNSAASRIGSVTAVTLTGLGLVAAKAGVSYNILKENATLAFTTLLKDGGKARDMIAQIEETAKKTPFGFEDLTRASQRLLAFGFAGEDVIPILTTVGDAVAAMGGGAAMIDRVTMAMGQMQTKGKVSGEEMMQLAEAGIPAWAILAENVDLISPKLAAAAKAAGWTQQQIIQRLQKMGEAGKLKSGPALAALRKGMATRFGGLGEAQSKTTAGATSALSDALKELFGALEEGPLKTITGYMITLAEEVPKVTKAFKELPQPVKDAFGWFAWGTLAVGSLAIAIGGATGLTALLGGAGLAGAGAAVGRVFGGLAGATGPFALFAAALLVAKLAYDRNVKPIFDGLELYMKTFPHVKIALTWANEQAKKVADWIMGLGPVISGAVKISVAWANKAAEDIVDWLGKASTTVKAAVAVAVAWASQAAEDLARWVSDLPANVTQTVKAAYEWASQVAYDLAVWVQDRLGKFGQTVEVAWSWLSAAAYDLAKWVQDRLGDFAQNVEVGWAWFSRAAYDLAKWVSDSIGTFAQIVEVAFKWASDAVQRLVDWLRDPAMMSKTFQVAFAFASTAAQKFYDWVVGTGGRVVTVGGGGTANHMAAGGIVTSPTLALIGEAGPEAVIPLSRMGGMGGSMVININAPIYGVNQLEDVIRRAIDRSRQRGGVG